MVYGTRGTTKKTRPRSAPSTKATVVKLEILFTSKCQRTALSTDGETEVQRHMLPWQSPGRPVPQQKKLKTQQTNVVRLNCRYTSRGAGLGTDQGLGPRPSVCSGGRPNVSGPQFIHLQNGGKIRMPPLASVFVKMVKVAMG